MSNSTQNLDNYLDVVKTELKGHPETDDIIHELRAHIWDVASNLSGKLGMSVEESFEMALKQMEEPVVLAKNFIHDDLPDNQAWREPKSILPERKYSNQEFVIFSVIGFFTATVILSIIAWIDPLTESDLSTIDIIVRVVQVLILVELIVGFLYYRNETEFKSQMESLKKRFEKMVDEEGELTDEAKAKFSALGTHVSGLFKLAFSSFYLIGVLYVSFVAEWSLFNDNWYSIVIYTLIIVTTMEIIEAIIKLFVGEIRISRLIKFIVDIFMFISIILTVLFYPFELAIFFEDVENPVGLFLIKLFFSHTSRPDYWFQRFIGMMGVFTLMEAFYNLGKFGAWNPEEQKSLTIK